MSQANVAVAAALYDAFTRGDIDGVVALLDPEVEWRLADNFLYSEGNPFRGPDAVRDGVFARVPPDWSRYEVQLEEYLDAGHTVVTRGRYHATHRRTGRPVDAQFAHVMKVLGGRIVFFQQYVDTAQFRDAAAE